MVCLPINIGNDKDGPGETKISPIRLVGKSGLCKLKQPNHLSGSFVFLLYDVNYCFDLVFKCPPVIFDLDFKN